MSGLFDKNLLRLDFDTSDESRFVLLVSERYNSELTPAEIFALEDAFEFEATAVYLRRFSDKRSPIPQIYIYDDTNDNFSNENLAKIHRNLWSNSRIPMFVVIGKTDVRFFDTRKPVTVTKNNTLKTSPFETLKLASDAIKLYSRELFDSGIFWETDKAKNHFKEEKSAYKLLIKDMNIVRDTFLKSKVLPKKTANKLLVFSILIKYLEERGDENENLFYENETLFAKDFFKKFGASKFCDVLRQKGKIVSLLEELSQHFNGRIFEWENEREKKKVLSADLNELADFLDADVNLENRQGHFWRKYSFNHLPVELISTVYESFLNERKDAVYTPEFLVNTLVDQSMSSSDFDQLSVKAIDVSCGSGIFLVSVFKRLVQRHRYAEFKKTGELKPLKSKKLLKIIKDNIFGVDIEEDAVRLTVFSICLALCDELTPKEIWTELEFDDTFQTNFKTQNFFDYLETEKDKLGTFDLVIGNVPFIELKVKKDKGDIYYFLDKENQVVKLNLEVSQKLDAKKNVFPRNQLALMFLDQSPYLLKENGVLCLIMPSAPLLYNNTAEFRKQFFPKYQVSQLLDFTNLDAILFGTAKVSAAAIFAQKQNPDKEKLIKHVTIRRTKTVNERIFFEIDKYDFHYVSQQSALHNKHVWKCNLLGGGRLSNLIDRLLKINSIAKYVKSKNWISGEGYIIGSDKTKAKKVRERASFITGKPSLPSDALDENGIDEAQIFNETAELFVWKRKKELFSPPVVLIKEIISDKIIPTHFSDSYLTFKHRIVGISAQKTERTKLLKLYQSFEDNKKTYSFIIVTTSNEFKIGRSTTILKQDIMNLPYSEDKKEMKLSYVEQILCDDVLDYQIDLLAKGSRAEINKDAKIKDIKKYGVVFNKMLNSVYGKSGKSFYLKKIYDLNDFFITEFNYGKNSSYDGVEKRDEPTNHIKSLIENAYSSTASIIRVLKLYEKNKIYFIKPKALRYWLRSIAIKDADESFSDSIEAGY